MVAMIRHGTLDLNQIALQQDRYPYVILQPLAFLIFFTAMLSELHRAPFDIPVAESEIVGGYFVEYSGIRWSMFMLSEYAAMWGFSIFGAVIFLGGWQFPMGQDWGWGWQLCPHDGQEPRVHLRHLWIRATVPRLRIDQLMSFCWKVLLPMTILQILDERLHPRLRLAARAAHAHEFARRGSARRHHHAPGVPPVVH